MKPLSLMIAVLTLAAQAAAQEATVEFDPAQTSIEFTLADVLHTVRGTFQMKTGSIHFDPSTGKATGAVVVDALSGDSGSHARDRRMHKDILESKSYPEMTFAPSSIKGGVGPKGESRIEVSGVLTLHGAAHEVSLPVSLKVDGDHLSAETHFVVPYVQWGLKNPSNFILRVSDKVDISIVTVGRIRFPHAADSGSVSAACQSTYQNVRVIHPN
jgi:polyisoprenoid-binding protein YceI